MSTVIYLFIIDLPDDSSVNLIIAEKHDKDMCQAYQGSLDLSTKFKAAYRSEMETSAQLRTHNTELIEQLCEQHLKNLDLKTSLSMVLKDMEDLKSKVDENARDLSESQEDLSETKGRLKSVEEELSGIKGRLKSFEEDLEIALCTAPAFFLALAWEVVTRHVKNNDSMLTTLKEMYGEGADVSALLDRVINNSYNLLHFKGVATKMELLQEVEKAQEKLRVVLPRHPDLEEVLKDAWIVFDMAHTILQDDEEKCIAEVAEEEEEVLLC